MFRRHWASAALAIPWTSTGVIAHDKPTACGNPMGHGNAMGSSDPMGSSVGVGRRLPGLGGGIRLRDEAGQGVRLVLAPRWGVAIRQGARQVLKFGMLRAPSCAHRLCIVEGHLGRSPPHGVFVAVVAWSSSSPSHAGSDEARTRDEGKYQDGLRSRRSGTE